MINTKDINRINSSKGLAEYMEKGDMVL